MGDVIEVPPDPNTQNWDSHGVPLQSTAILTTDVPKWNQSCKPEPLHVCTKTMPGVRRGERKFSAQVFRGDGSSERAAHVGKPAHAKSHFERNLITSSTVYIYINDLTCNTVYKKCNLTFELLSSTQTTSPYLSGHKPCHWTSK